MKLSDVKLSVVEAVDSQRSELIMLSKRIHDNPELAYKEVKAVSWLCEYLSKNNFVVNKGIAGLRTAFKAVYGTGLPVISLLAEYDALPDIGHACGHNIIAAAAVGAGLASRCAVDLFGGTIVVFGTPAEEVSGGKIDMVLKGAFNDIDVALIIHPGSRDIGTIEALACSSLDVEFYGKAAHAAAHPEQGINALDAMLLSFNAINSLRQHTQDRSRIHGIIVQGGEVANVIPEYTSAKFLVRADDNKYLDELKTSVVNCFKGAAKSTGCRLRYRWGNRTYNTMNNNMSLANIFSDNLKSLGRKVQSFDPRYGFGSTDMGNVSHQVPAIHPSISITNASNIHTHTKEFAQAVISESGHRAMLDGAKAMAMTIVDLLGDENKLTAVKSEFISNQANLS